MATGALNAQALLDQSMKAAMEPIEARMTAIETKLEEQKKIEVVNPNEARWDSVPAPEEVRRASEAGFAGAYDGFFTRAIDDNGNVRFYYNPEPGADKLGYKPPPTAAHMGLRGARVIRAAVLANFDANRVPGILRDTYGDVALANLVEKSYEQIRALNTGTPSAGGVLLVTPMLAAEFIPLLYDYMGTRKLGAREIPMPAGSAMIPGLATGVSGGWIGEATENNASEPTFFAKQASAKKAFALVAISNDQLQESSIAVDALVRDDMLRGLGVTIENAAIQGAGTAFTPRGLKYETGKTSVTIGAVPTADHPTSFQTALMNAKVDFAGRKMGWLFNPTYWGLLRNLKTSTGAYHFREEMNNGRLDGHPYEVSTLIASTGSSPTITDVYFGDWAELLYLMTRSLSVESSREASYLDTSGNRRSAFIQGVTIIKAESKLDVMYRQSAAMAYSADAWTAA